MPILSPLAPSAPTHLLGSLGPDDGACTVYSDAACSKPISGLEGFQNPGNSNLPASNIDSYLCINPVLSPVGSGKARAAISAGTAGSARPFQARIKTRSGRWAPTMATAGFIVTLLV
ncbi:hypothetical protein V502_00382 [Pseudogymnoascus sp. VKM F-4520 (FW-2644)]|nr:hypothetical protein V502_00382 [Pseudogymnoascus sp. VKM F-4520 (FW-2644)]